MFLSNASPLLGDSSHYWTGFLWNELFPKQCVQRHAVECPHLVLSSNCSLPIALSCHLQKTKGGIVIPEKAQGKVNEAKVVAIGPGARGKVG